MIAHDASAALGRIGAPTLVTFGARDLVRSTRFAEPLMNGIAGSELVVFDHLSHAGLHEDPETFNDTTLDFLLRRDDSRTRVRRLTYGAGSCGVSKSPSISSIR